MEEKAEVGAVNETPLTEEELRKQKLYATSKEEYEAMSEEDKAKFNAELNGDRIKALSDLKKTLVKNSVGTLAMAHTKMDALIKCMVALDQLGEKDMEPADDVYNLFPPTMNGLSVVTEMERINDKRSNLSNSQKKLIQKAFKVYMVRTENAKLVTKATDVVDMGEGVDEPNNEGDVVADGTVESPESATMDGVPVGKIQHMKG